MNREETQKMKNFKVFITESKTISIGIIVTDGNVILGGKAPNLSTWDIPKGLPDPGETPADTAVREAHEEFGIHAPKSELKLLGTFKYRPEKDLTLFLWKPQVLPLIQDMRCYSEFEWYGKMLPEFINFKYISFKESNKYFNKSFIKILNQIKNDII